MGYVSLPTTGFSGKTVNLRLAYIERVLKNPNNWLIHSVGLLLKSRIEVVKSKTVDRACMQIEVLVNQFDRYEF